MTLMNSDESAKESSPFKVGTSDNFMEFVFDESNTHPVVVEFWTSMSDTCQQLRKKLEHVAKSYQEKLSFVSINIEEAPDIAHKLRIQAVPTVIVFKEGRPVDGFTGLQPENRLKAFLERLASQTVSPMEHHLEEAGSLIKRGDIVGAMNLYNQVLGEHPDNAKALIGLGQCYFAMQDLKRAKTYLTLVKDGDGAHKFPEYISLKSALELYGETIVTEKVEILQKKVLKNPQDLEAHFNLSMAFYRQGDYNEALEQLFIILSHDRTWNDYAAQKKLLKLFEVFGPEDPLTIQGRKRLSTIVFS
ncbi:tetratricopeptide repeat protein [Candidatus Nucleicultrix amoebiphila]|jgi:putative thioredoxin|uniref:tetratricopeptide repeat protein n=1 Tax=Candidatus Nucleicultrix amoebiphila TaxID=1509244 RepID=UPI000A270BD6|nr:tetratricopeptide repeat protein [Candidatus Nucleicultrix amoebiphila]